MTKAHARILAGMLSGDAREVLRVYRDRKHATVTEDGVNEVKQLKLISKETDLLSNKKIWVLTRDGKKVVEYL